MELEDKIKKLEEQFKSLPKVLIKRTLCGDDVNEDITKATDRLREFQQIKNSLFYNPVAATPVTEESTGSLNVTPAEELIRNSMPKNSIVEGTETARGHRTGDRKAKDPPKPKPKPNWRKSHEHDEDCKEMRDPTLPLCKPSAIGLLTHPPTWPPRSLAQSTSPAPRTYSPSIPEPYLPHCSPPPPQSHRSSTPEPPIPYVQSAPPLPPSHRWSTPGPPLRHIQSPSPPSPPPPPPDRWSTLGPPLPHAQSTPPPRQRWSTPGPPPPLAKHPLPAPRTTPPPTPPSIKKCVHSKVTAKKARKDNDAALETSKATNNGVQEEQMELEEKIKMLKEEFSSLPRVLIKKTLCDDAVKGDVAKAKQRLMEFKPQFKGREHCFKNAEEAGRDVDKLDRNSNNSPVFRHANMASIHFEEQALPERENQLPRNWVPMPPDDRGKDVDIHLVKLPSSSVEYQDVVERLQQTVSSNPMIKSVERIQNPYLYQAYQLRKQKMDRDNPQGNNERQLFHGTNSDNVKKINRQGFDRSFSGSAHGAVYGGGVYFARDASYSMCYTGGSHQVLYPARVLVGRYCKGSSSMKKPPPINSEQPEILFDSMVDNINDPSIFVVYHDNQSYPEYLITI